MTNLIEVRNLHVSYGDRPVLRGLDLDVPQGSIFGLIGPNGAGKTTALRAMLGMLAPEQGSIQVFGQRAAAMDASARQRIGYLAEGSSPMSDIAFGDALRVVSGFYAEWDWDWCAHLLERLGVEKHKALDAMSLGQRRVAELLLAVAHRPELLVLDDPAVGLDARVRRDVLWTLLETVQEQGTTVLFSSHILQDVERIVDRVGILTSGRLRLCGELDAVKSQVRRVVLSAATAPAALPGEIYREAIGSEVVVVTQGDADALKHLPGVFDEQGLNLEEIFLAYAGSEASS